MSDVIERSTQYSSDKPYVKQSQKSATSYEEGKLSESGFQKMSRKDLVGQIKRYETWLAQSIKDGGNLQKEDSVIQRMHRSALLELLKRDHTGYQLGKLKNDLEAKQKNSEGFIALNYKEALDYLASEPVLSVPSLVKKGGKLNKHGSVNDLYTRGVQAAGGLVIHQK